MGLFSSLFSSDSKDEIKIEGRKGNDHTHKDGTSGYDIYAAKVSYRDGNKTGEKNAEFGHVSVKEDGSKTDHLK